MDVVTIDNGLAESLQKEFKTKDLTICLNKIGVLDNDESLTSYTDLTKWLRGGAETYIAISSVTTNKGLKKFIAKALISIASQPDKQLEGWMKRRKIIESLNIRTPKLFSALNGVIYEQFIDEPLIINPTVTRGVIEQLVFIASQLDSIGFTTLSFINDIRISSDDLYYVDFGSDLGEPSYTSGDCATKYLLSKLDSEQILFAKSLKGEF